ncbi:transposase-like protein [Colletotrichum truncatum]|uniref:Transposase-like protein n=1 Tax=Colletotrichum truncatum TaxID=5467 RepID=A0ACC3YDR8_COLTU
MDAWPDHSETENTALNKPAAYEFSQKSSIPADHRVYIRISIKHGWKKLGVYYSKLGESPLLAAAVIFHPRFGIGWLEATWLTEEQLAWARDVKLGIKDYFARWYDTKQQKDEEKSRSTLLSRTLGKENDHYQRCRQFK